MRSQSRVFIVEPLLFKSPKLMKSFFGDITDKMILCLKCQEVYNLRSSNAGQSPKSVCPP
jgi:hypothetical protein